MWICEVCKKKQATVHLTTIENNVKREQHMCEDCASSKGLSVKATVHLPQALAGLAKAELRSRRDQEQDLMCDACGMLWSEFRSGGRFGCANDYVAFRSQLEEIIGDIHVHDAQHVGKAPKGKGMDTELRRQLLECRRRLRDAVDREAYEEAARLRDELAELDRRVNPHIETPDATEN